MCKASICIAVHNGEKFICETLKSIQSQTFTEFEIVIVDDHSTDDTVDIIMNQFVSQDSRFKLYTNITDELSQYVDSHNKSYELAKGELLFRIDQDDILDKNYLQVYIDYMDEHPKINGICTRSNYILYKDYNLCDYENLDNLSSAENYEQMISSFNAENTILLQCGAIFENETSCLRKNFYDKYKPEFEIHLYGDYIFWNKCIAMGAKLNILCIEPVHIGRKHASNTYSLFQDIMYECEIEKFLKLQEEIRIKFNELK